jgi:hypothetical protein
VRRRDRQRLDDIQAALDAIDEHLTRGELSDGLVYDAVRVRLIEIGEAVKGLSADRWPPSPTCPGRRSPACGTGSPTATSTPPTPSSKAPSTTTYPSSPRRSRGSGATPPTDQRARPCR